MASSPFWKLRRLAPRAKRVYNRRAPQKAAVAAYGPTLVPAVDAFIAAYDSAAKYEAKWSKELGEGKGAIAALVVAIRSWLPRITQDVKGFDPSDYADQPDVPDDVLEDGERFVSVIEEHKDDSDKPLAYQKGALDELTPILEAAQKEWSEADDIDVVYQKMLGEVRSTGAVFDKELQAFRRTLAGAFGRNDKDYQKLRAERATQKDEDDDPSAPAPAPKKGGGEDK